MKRRLDLKITPYSYQPRIAKEFSPHYPEPMIEAYFKRQVRDGEQDHGVIGGLTLFNSLYLNYVKTERENPRANGTHIYTPQGDHWLIWRPEQLDFFVLAADAVICHNLWTVQAQEDPVKAQLYRENGLEALVIENPSQRLDIREHTLEFLLKLVDTIEPTKRFTELSPRQVLDQMSVTATHDSECLELRIQWTEELAEGPKFPNWKGSLLGMEKWLNLTAAEEENSIRLRIPIRETEGRTR